MKKQPAILTGGGDYLAPLSIHFLEREITKEISGRKAKLQERLLKIPLAEPELVGKEVGEGSVVAAEAPAQDQAEEQGFSSLLNPIHSRDEAQRLYEREIHCLERLQEEITSYHIKPMKIDAFSAHLRDCLADEEKEFLDGKFIERGFLTREKLDALIEQSWSDASQESSSAGDDGELIRDALSVSLIKAYNEALRQQNENARTTSVLKASRQNILSNLKEMHEGFDHDIAQNVPWVREIGDQLHHGQDKEVIFKLLPNALDAFYYRIMHEKPDNLMKVRGAAKRAWAEAMEQMNEECASPGFSESNAALSKISEWYFRNVENLVSHYINPKLPALKSPTTSVNTSGASRSKLPPKLNGYGIEECLDVMAMMCESAESRIEERKNEFRNSDNSNKNYYKPINDHYAADPLCTEYFSIDARVLRGMEKYLDEQAAHGELGYDKLIATFGHLFDQEVRIALDTAIDDRKIEHFTSALNELKASLIHEVNQCYDQGVMYQESMRDGGFELD